MIQQLAALTLIVLMHIVCFSIMTVRKYSVKKNSFNLFAVYCRLYMPGDTCFAGAV